MVNDYQALKGYPLVKRCKFKVMRTKFVLKVFEELLTDNVLATTSSLLVVAGGAAERDLFELLKLQKATITNLDTGQVNDALYPYEWDYQDAQSLTYVDKSYDWVVVVDGLHHCASPHRALTEMYRCCRVGVIAVEARDSLVMRVATRFGFSSSYEIEAVRHQGGMSGGLENGPVPNYVYRWTEREFHKTIRSCDPTGTPQIFFRYGLNLPYETASLRGWKAKTIVMRLAEPLLKLFMGVFPRQKNSIAMVATRPETVFSWLTEESGELTFRDPLHG